MLYEFLEKYKTDILALVEKKTSLLGGSLVASDELKKGLPGFYCLILNYLMRPALGSTEKDIVISASEHGRELLRLGYSLSQVVHTYGAVCQAVTEMAYKKNYDISSKEFNNVNLCLDIAIAAAVSEYQYRSVHASEQKEVQSLGILAHELRNSLSSATIAHEMVRHGYVGTSGSTAKVLEQNLARMQYLIDHALSEVRMRANPEIIIETFKLEELIHQILLTAKVRGDEKQLKIKTLFHPNLSLSTDRQLLLSAIANLVQNAIKYNKQSGEILVRTKDSNKNAIIEVQDTCGGIDADKIDGIFKPFVYGSGDSSGMGLGLTIIKRATSLLQGNVSVKNTPGKGCKFIIEIPKKLNADKIERTTVSGLDSIQPKPTKKD